MRFQSRAFWDAIATAKFSARSLERRFSSSAVLPLHERRKRSRRNELKLQTKDILAPGTLARPEKIAIPELDLREKGVFKFFKGGLAQFKNDSECQKKLKSLSSLDDKLKYFSPELLKILEDTFIKFFKAFVEKDYHTLETLTRPQYFHEKKAEREKLADLHWKLRKTFPGSFVTSWCTKVYDHITGDEFYEFFVVGKFKFDHALNFAFKEETHFVVFHMNEINMHSGWKVYAQIMPAK